MRSCATASRGYSATYPATWTQGVQTTPRLLFVGGAFLQAAHPGNSPASSQEPPQEPPHRLCRLVCVSFCSDTHHLHRPETASRQTTSNSRSQTASSRRSLFSRRRSSGVNITRLGYRCRQLPPDWAAPQAGEEGPQENLEQIEMATKSKGKKQVERRIQKVVVATNGKNGSGSHSRQVLSTGGGENLRHDNTLPQALWTKVRHAASEVLTHWDTFSIEFPCREQFGGCVNFTFGESFQECARCVWTSQFLVSQDQCFWVSMCTTPSTWSLAMRLAKSGATYSTTRLSPNDTAVDTWPRTSVTFRFESPCVKTLTNVIQSVPWRNGA